MSPMHSDQIKEYLARIDYSGDRSATLAVLQNLQRTHLQTVPFENLDIHNGVEIVLDEQRLFDKIVGRRRGGFCYELNGLFFALLQGLGFEVIRIAARVYNRERGFGPPFDHMAILATINEMRYLVDVGYGEFAIAPLKMVMDIEQSDERGVFVISHRPDGGLFLVAKLDNGESVPEYLFDNRHHALAEYASTCQYHQTDPASHFTQGKLISLATENGRMTLTDKTFKVRVGLRTEEHPVAGPAEFDRLLSTYFGTHTRR